MKSDLGTSTPGVGNSPQRRQMAVGNIALELLAGDEAPRINALSMASSGIHVDSELHVCVVSTRISVAVGGLTHALFQCDFG
jgi:hypothetical protein